MKACVCSGGILFGACGGNTYSILLMKYEAITRANDCTTWRTDRFWMDTGIVPLSVMGSYAEMRKEIRLCNPFDAKIELRNNR